MRKSCQYQNLFKNKKVVIMGLGLNNGGVGSARFFVLQGAKVLVTDLKTRSQLKESVDKLKGLDLKFILGKHREEDFKTADLIIKNPDVPADSLFLKIARGKNIPVKDDISLFFDLCPGEIIGITGTKGKSTVATLIYEILKNKYPTVLAGNIGVSPLELLSKITKKTKVALELSSFALENLKKSPHIAVITNLFPDHLNRYKNFRHYIEAKKSIFKYQNRNDILILNRADKEAKKLSSEAKSRVYFFNRANEEAAKTVAKIYRVSKKIIQKSISNFKGIPNRQEFIGEKRGVKYFNDTAATNPTAASFTLKIFKKQYPQSRIILIAGGVDKKLSYKSLAEDIKENVCFLILLPGTGSDKMKKGLKNFSFCSAGSMREAVKRASKTAAKGDIVLLSPGGASFNLFKNEFDRGRQFIKEVDKL